MSYAEWDGQVLGARYLALATSHAQNEALPAPTPTLLRACTGKRRFLVRVDQLERVLTTNPSLVLVGFDGGSLFSAVENQLRVSEQWAAWKAWWDVTRSCRLHDVKHLFLLFLRARSGADYLAFSYEEVAASFKRSESAQTGSELLGATDEPTGLGRADSTIAIEDVEMVLRMYRRLRLRALQLLRQLGVKHCHVEKFGPLGIGVQVQGAVAATYASNSGLRLRTDAVSGIRETCRVLWHRASKHLHADPIARGAFLWNGDEVIKDKAGLPSRKPENLRNWLESLAAPESMRFHPELIPPRRPNGSISIMPDDWGEQVHSDPGLQAWSELWTAASVQKSLDKAEAGTVRSLYAVLPRLGSRKPNLVQFRRLFRTHAFEAEHGYALVVAKLPDLLLRCHAEICEHQSGQSQLGGLFRHAAYWSEHESRTVSVGGRAVLTPTEYVAWRLVNYERRRKGRSEMGRDRFGEICRRHPHALNRFLKVSEALLDNIPRGLGPTHVRDRLLKDHSLEISPSEAGQLVDWFVDALPDLGWFVFIDDTFEIVSEKFGCEARELESVLVGQTLESSAVSLRKLVSGQVKATPAFAGLREVCRTSHWKVRLNCAEGSPELFQDLFARFTCSPIGRTRRVSTAFKSQLGDFIDAAEDVMKAVVFAVLAAGFDVRAFTDDEFVIQVRRVEDSDLQRIKTIAEAAARPLFRVPDFAPRCHVTNQDCW